MGQDLFGKQVLDTYDAIIKVGDNDTLTGIAKQLSDGRGNDAPIWLSTARMGIGITPDTNYTLTVNGAAKIGSLDVNGAVTAASVRLTGGSGSQGLMTWNTDEETVDIVQNGATLQVGQEVQVHVKNQTGALIPDGTPVYVTGTLGSSGRLTVAPMIADGTIEAKYFLGITTEDIGDGEDGKVTTFGKIRGLNTSAYSEGTTLYVSALTAGAFQTTAPVAPNLDLEVAIVINSHVNNGTIFVRAQNGQYLGLLHDVYLNNPTEKDLLVYNNTSSRWENSKTIGDLSAGNLTLSGYLRGATNFVIDPAAYGDETGVVQILGDLRVDGTTTTINSTTVTIDDKNIVLASGSATAADANGAGITIDGASATMLYESASDRLVFNKDLEVTSGQIRVENDSTYVAKIVFSENTNQDVFVLEYNGVGTGGTNYFQIYSDVTGWAGKGDSLNIQPSTGRVAIGNTSFDEVLHVTGNVKATTFIGDLQGNADTASALSTARNIAVDGAVTGNADFDGSGDIIITTTVNHNHDADYVNVTGDTMSDSLNIVHNNVGIVTFYSKSSIEAIDAQLDLISSSDGVWGSAINFVEGASTTANTDIWSIARQTTGGSGDSSLRFNFGTTNAHNNTTQVTFSSSGDVTATNFIGDLDGDITGNADTVDNKHATDFNLQYVTTNGASTTKPITIADNSASFTALTLETSADSYVKQDFKTDTIGTSTAFLIAYGSANPQDGAFAIKNNANHTTTNGTAGDIWFAANSAERLRIHGDTGQVTINQDLIVYDKVAIGQTSSASQKLHVNGNIIVGGQSSGFVHSGGRLAVSADGDVIIVTDSNDTEGATPDGKIIFGGGSLVNTDANQSFTFADAFGSGSPRNEWARLIEGRFGIGETDPDTKLYIKEEAVAPTLITLHNTISTGDITNDGGRGNFIDFKTTDANANFTPQVRIGMVVQDYSGDGGIPSEGTGNFVVYTGEGTDSEGNGTLTESFRVREDNAIEVFGSTNLLIQENPNGLWNINADEVAINGLKIYDNGTNTLIDNNNGALIIRNLVDDQDIVLSSDDGSGGLDTYLRVDGSEGSVILYHYGSAKLETTSTGVSVTGALSGNIDTSSISGDTIDINGTTAINLQYNGTTQLRVDSTGVAYLGTVTFANDGISLTDEDSTIDSFFHANVDYDGGLYTVTSNARYGSDYIQVDGLDSRDSTKFTISPKDIGSPDPHAYLYIGGDNSITAPNTLVDWHTIEMNALSVQINGDEVATRPWVVANTTLQDVTNRGATTTADITVGASAVQGGRFISPNYNGTNRLGILSSMYSSGNLLIGYGLEGNSGANGYVSTYENFSGRHGGIEVYSKGFKYVGDTTNSQTTIGNTLTVVEYFNLNEGNLTISSDLSAVNGSFSGDVGVLGTTTTNDIIIDHNTGSLSHGVIFRGVASSAGEVGIRANGEAFEIYEPEQANKVWLSIADDPEGNGIAAQLNSPSGFTPILTNYNKGSYITKAYIDGLGVDADTLDTLNSTQFLRSDESDTINGALTIFHDTFNEGLILHRDHAGNAASIRFTNNSGNAGTLYATYADTSLRWNDGDSTNGHLIWHSGNDGSGSNLDADKLDGLQASQFLRSDADDTTTGTLTIQKSLADNTFLNLLNQDTQSGSDLSQQKSFIDFTFIDSNTNETPQVRIGAEVGQNGDADSQIKEGSGAFVVYTNNADTISGDAGASLAERFRVDYAGNANLTGDLTVSGSNAVIHAGNIGSQSVNYAAGAGSVGGYTADQLLKSNTDDYTTGKLGVRVSNATAALEVAGTDGWTSPSYYKHAYVQNLGRGIAIAGNESTLDIIGQDLGSHSASIVIRGANAGFSFINDPSADELKLRYFQANADNFSVHGSGVGVQTLTDIVQFKTDGDVTFTNDVTVERLRINNETDASLTSTGHGLQIGADASQNLIFDNNEIISRNNGVASELYLQNNGGTVYVGSGGLNVAGTITGNGSGLTAVNATTLDTLDSTQFLRSDANDTATGDISFTGKVYVQRGSTAAQSYHDLYIGGDNLASADSAIYIGNRGDGTGYGWELYYVGSGSGNANRLQIKSENLGSPKVAVDIYQDGTFILPSGGNLAIGTYTASYPFTLETAGTGLASRIYNSNADGQGLLIRAGATTSATRVLQLASSNDTKIMTVNSNGRVGIGEVNPSFPLHVSGKIYSTTEVQGGVATMRSYGGYAFFGSNASTTPLAFGRDGTNYDLVIDGAGNVGIGQTSVDGRLHILNGAGTKIRHGLYGSIGNRYSAWDTWIGNNVGVATDSTSNVQLLTSYIGDGASALNVGFKTLAYYQWSSTDLTGLSAGSNLTLPTPSLKISPTGLVGIGTDSPQTLLHLKSNGDAVLRIEADADNVTETDNPAIQLIQDGGLISSTIAMNDGNELKISTDQALAVQIGANNANDFTITTDNHFAFGSSITTTSHFMELYDATPWLCITNTAETLSGIRFEDAQAIGAQYALFGYNSSTNHIEMHINGTNRFQFNSNGEFHADNDIVAFSATTSDARLKDDVKTIDNALDKVLSMRGVEYVWNNGGRKGQKDIGVIAQEIEQVIPEIVREHELPLMDNSGEKYKTVDYEKITGVLIEAIKEQQKQIDELKEIINGGS